MLSTIVIPNWWVRKWRLRSIFIPCHKASKWWSESSWTLKLPCHGPLPPHSPLLNTLVPVPPNDCDSQGGLRVRALSVYLHSLSMDTYVVFIRHLCSGKSYSNITDEHSVKKNWYRVSPYKDDHSMKRNSQEPFQGDISQTETERYIQYIWGPCRQTQLRWTRYVWAWHPNTFISKPLCTLGLGYEYGDIMVGYEVGE